MKQTIFFILIFILINSCRNDQDIYLSQDYETVFKLAPKTGKKIFIDFYTTWCGSCKGFDKFIFPDSAFQTFLMKDFYSLKLNAELPKNRNIANKYRITAYPTIIIADSAGNEINRILGYKENKPEYYIELIENILKGKENFELYKNEYLNSPDSTELAEEIILKLFEKEDYQSVASFVEIIKSKSKNEALLFNADLYLGFSRLYNKQFPDPEYLKNIFLGQSDLDDYWKENILTGLIGYYEDTEIDSFEYYSYILEKNFPMSFYWNRKFALYLYENKKDLETAYRITNNYAINNANDHWAPFLQGHQLISKGKTEDAFVQFNKWMEKNCNPDNIEDDINHYYFYIDLAVYSNFSLKKALEYAEKLEKNASSIANRKLLAKLYYLTNQKDKSLDILKETIPILESSKEKTEVDKLILEYSK